MQGAARPTLGNCLWDSIDAIYQLLVSRSQSRLFRAGGEEARRAYRIHLSDYDNGVRVIDFDWIPHPGSQRAGVTTQNI